MTNTLLRDELLSMLVEDDFVREHLAADGSLFDGYNPIMESIHRKNTQRLREIIGQYGWPGFALVGKEGCNAAWRIAQHSIGDPTFQRIVLQLLQDAAEKKDVPVWQPAMLEDRIRTLEGRLQIYGTQFDWDDSGKMSPLPVEDMEHVNERRASIGLGPIEEATQKQRELMLDSTEKPPKDPAARKAEMEAWARSAGWRK